jgi:DNA topoisomerase-1
MSYTLLIVESPAKCNKIESYLGDGYKCAASFGHIRELADGLNSIDISNNFQPTFKECEDKKQQITKLRKLIDSAEEVILASDDDREGEAIAWHLCEVFGLSVATTKRIVFHEITEIALKRAVAEATIINMNIVNAQISRQILDVLVGYKLSPVLWKYIAKCKKTGLSAGRCQTPALRLVYENQKEINASPGRKVYTTTGYFTAHNLPFVLKSEIESEETMTAFLEASVNHTHVYSCGPMRNTVKAPPTPFTTSTLQQAASNELRVSPKETMKLCQKLYEGGYITYMRTDSTTLSDEFIDKATNYIEKKYGKEYVRIVVDDNTKEKVEKKEKISKKKSTKKDLNVPEPDHKRNCPEPDHKRNCAHEAIRPTDITKDLKGNEELSTKEIKMYQLIHRNTLESCMSPATYNGFTAFISAPAIPTAALALVVGHGAIPIPLVVGHGAIPPAYGGEGQVQQMAEPPAISLVVGGKGAEPPAYKYPIEQSLFKGWKIVAGVEDNNKEFNYLQALANKQTTTLNYKKITAKVSIKDSKSHLSEAKLVQLLEQEGIGRPSTFSSLIDKIQERGYVKVDNVKGSTIKCVDFELEGEELSQVEVDREFGNEKNKLVIQSTGTLVLDFLLNHFDPLFKYDYTKHMEDSLDLIAKGDKLWYELCRECLEQITTLIKELKVDKNKENKEKKEKEKGEADNDNNEKLSIKVDEHHEYIIGKHGPVLKYTGGSAPLPPTTSASAADGIVGGSAHPLHMPLPPTTSASAADGIVGGSAPATKLPRASVPVSFKPVREDIDIDKLKRGEYTVEELVVENKLTGHLLGMYDNKEVYLKNGKFGYYIEYGELKKAVRIGLKKPTDVTLDDVADVLFDSTSEQAFSRIINENLSIRNGKFGDYIFYKTKTMKKPQFFKLKGFKEDYKTCELSILIKWINETAFQKSLAK